MKSLLRQQPPRFTGVFAVLLVTLVVIVYLYLFSSAVYAQRRVVFVVFDSCGFEVAKAVNRLYFRNSGVIVFSREVSDIDPGLYYVVLATNISSRTEISRILDLILTRNGKYVATSVVGAGESVISHEDLWSYCLYGDEDALRRVVEAIRVEERSQSPPLVLPLLVGAVALISASTISLNQSLRGRVKSLLERAWGALAVFFSILLGIRIRGMDVLEHPVRKAIYERVSSEGAVPVSALTKTYSRGVLEWHLSVLIRAGFLREVRVGNRRFIIDALNAQKALSRLAEIDARVECVLENIKNSLSVQEVSEKCRVDERAVLTILNSVTSNHIKLRSRW